MSDPRAKAERSRAKDLRQGIVDQRPVSSKSSKKKPWVVRADWTVPWPRDRETVIGRYAKLSDAEKAAESTRRKSYYTNVRIEEE
jgi:hypothetical protein